MEIVWDETKRLTNLAKHGMDFTDLTEDFFASAIIVDGKDGRSLAIGRIGPTAIVVVFKPLGSEAISIISMRYAGKKERTLL